MSLQLKNHNAKRFSCPKPHVLISYITPSFIERQIYSALLKMHLLTGTNLKSFYLNSHFPFHKREYGGDSYLGINLSIHTANIYCVL